MTIHIFNPEHDIALASGLSNFTAPHAGRQLRHDLGFLPAIWAGEDDVIVVDDAEYAAHAWEKAARRIVSAGETNGSGRGNKVFLSWKQLSSLKALTTGEPNITIEPWGWNSALRALLLRSGLPETLLPSLPMLETVRELSHRRVAASLLPQLRVEGTVGESVECRTQEETVDAIRRYGRAVLKAPWSSSGRGLRFCDAARLKDSGKTINDNGEVIDDNGKMINEKGWLRNVLTTQGSVMVEPYYNKVKDFGMEFESDGAGLVRYLGLSLFHTQNGAYTGNVLATEATKAAMMAHYLPETLLVAVREEICRKLGPLFSGRYRGPFGVDMMVCGSARSEVQGTRCDVQGTRSEEGFLLHPCVEINLRRTMGHVALALSPHDDDIRRVMRIEYNENVYKLRIK